MILTGEVTIEWLEDNNLTRFNEVGVPRRKGNVFVISWRKVEQLTNADFDAIEIYYKHKTETNQ